MKLIETKTLTTAQSSIVFSGIPQNFTDLLIVASVRSLEASIGNSGLEIRPNGSTANGSSRWLYGSGSSASSITPSRVDGGFINSVGHTSNTFSSTSIYIPNYSGSTNKSFSADTVQETNATLNYSAIVASLWSDTAAITSLDFRCISATNLVAGSTISLYGIGGVGDGYAPKATGGSISYSNGYWYHTFRSSGTFTPNGTVTADVLMIAGGGSGSAGIGGGGGAGGILGFASQSLTGAKTITIGAGGPAITGAGTDGDNGDSTTFTGLTTAVGGGGGGGYAGSRSGKTGGSGGGGTFTPPATSGGAGTSGQGFAGGAGGNAQAGGGGGAGGVGANGANPAGTVGAAGGAGTDNVTNLGSIVNWLSATQSGVGSKIAGGGSSAGDGGPGAVQGGGGLGAAIFGSPYPNASPAIVNTGGGGGGGSQGTSGGGAGGSGIVIVRYLA